MPSSQSVVQLSHPVETQQLPPVHVSPQSSVQSVPHTPQPLSTDEVHSPPVHVSPQSSVQVVPQVPQPLSTVDSQSPPEQAPQSSSQLDWQTPQPLSTVPVSSDDAQSPPEQAPQSFWQSDWQMPHAPVSVPESSPTMMTGLSDAASLLGKMIMPLSGIPGFVIITLVTAQRVVISIWGSGQLVTS
jgi:hypothetical protein